MPQLTLNNRIENTQSITVFYILFLISHILLYCLIANLHDVKYSYILMILSSFLFCY